MTTVLKLWTETIAKGFQVRSLGLDGLAEWQPIKKEHADDCVVGMIDGILLKPNIPDLVNSGGCLRINEDKKDLTDAQFILDNLVLDNSDPKGHFLIQHFRIPIMCGARIHVVKLLQIAYNVGQFQAIRDENGYDDKINKFYDQHKLYDLHTYIEPIAKQDNFFTNNQAFPLE